MNTPISKFKERLLKTPNAKWEKMIEERTIECALDQVPSVGKHAEVLLGKRLDNENVHYTPSKVIGDKLNSIFSPNIALKTQCIQQPKDLQDKSYRELLILKELNTLQKKHNIPLFIGLYDWFKSQGDYLASKTKKREFEFMNFVLEKADETLNDHLKKCKNILSLSKFKTILFQILYALHAAQELCEFVHYDLHLKNIMIKALPKNANGCAFHHEGFTFYTHEKFLIKITDFGLSRIKIPSTQQLIYNDKNIMAHEFDPFEDVSKLVTELGRIKIDWSADSSLNIEEQKKHLSNLKRRMKKRTDVPGKLLLHPFFESLKNCSTKDGLVHFGNDEPQIPVTPISQITKAIFETPKKTPEETYVTPIRDRNATKRRSRRRRTKVFDVNENKENVNPNLEVQKTCTTKQSKERRVLRKRKTSIVQNQTTEIKTRTIKRRKL